MALVSIHTAHCHYGIPNPKSKEHTQDNRPLTPGFFFYHLKWVRGMHTLKNHLGSTPQHLYPLPREWGWEVANNIGLSCSFVFMSFTSWPRKVNYYQYNLPNQPEKESHFRSNRIILSEWAICEHMVNMCLWCESTLMLIKSLKGKAVCISKMNCRYLINNYSLL